MGKTIPIRSIATTAFHHWIPQSAPLPFGRHCLKPNLCGFSEFFRKASSCSDVRISLSISLSTSMRKSVTSCRCGWPRARSWGLPGDRGEPGLSSWGSRRSENVSLNKLCFWTGILTYLSAKRSWSCMRLFICFKSATCGHEQHLLHDNYKQKL